MVYRICFLPLPAALVVTYLPPEVIACLHCDILFSACGDIGCHSLLLKFQCFPDSRCLEALIFRSKKWHVMSLFSKKIFWFAKSTLLFIHYDSKRRGLRSMRRHTFFLKFQRPRTLWFWKYWFCVQKSGVPCHFLKKKIWSCCFTFWYFDNKSRKSRIKPWHIFERVFIGFRTFIIRNYWKISISPVSDSDTLWNRDFLMSIIAIRTGNVVSIIDKFICWNFNIF